MESDGIAALRCWPVRVSVGGADLLIPALPAIEWIVPIADQEILDIVPGLVEGDSVDEMLADGSVSIEDCVDAARDAIAVAGGMPWWVVVRLVLSATGSADLSGELVLSGVDAGRVSLGGFVQAVYRLLVRDADQKQRQKVDGQLKRPPAGVSGGGYDPQVAGDLFDQMVRARGGGS